MASSSGLRTCTRGAIWIFPPRCNSNVASRTIVPWRPGTSRSPRGRCPAGRCSSTRRSSCVTRRRWCPSSGCRHHWRRSRASRRRHLLHPPRRSRHTERSRPTVASVAGCDDRDVTWLVLTEKADFSYDTRSRSRRGWSKGSHAQRERYTRTPRPLGTTAGMATGTRAAAATMDAAVAASTATTATITEPTLCRPSRNRQAHPKICHGFTVRCQTELIRA